MEYWKTESEYISQGYELVCGVDEAGRGPLAGPVYAAAVILRADMVIEGLDDSKKLSEKRRDALFDEIIAKAAHWGVGTASVEEIDSINILNATYLAMNRAIEAMGVEPQLALIDGNRSEGIKYENRCIVKGDATCASIAAASILAKVSRDRYMLELAAECPQYRFEQHKGYGTKLHYEMLERFGVSPVHRRSFLTKFAAKAGIEI